jgi:hypothetical protein
MKQHYFILPFVDLGGVKLTTRKENVRVDEQ